MSFVAGSGKINVDLLYSGLERIPAEGEELYSKDFNVCLGGGTVGTLINLARLNVPVKIQTAYADDLFSRYAVGELNKYGVTVKNCHTGTRFPLNITSAAITGSDRTFLTYGSDAVVNESMMTGLYDMCKGAKIVMMERGYLPVYRELKKDGAILVLDLGWFDDLSIANYREYLEVADLFTPSRQEAMKMTGCGDYVAAARVLHELYDCVIIKLDKAGCYVSESGNECVIPAIDEFQHVDSTGAGDAFLAGLTYGLYKDRPLRECVLLGNLTGGKCVTAVGCLTNYYEESELLTDFERYAKYAK